MLQGGGGYTLRNIPRCWTYETSIALGMELPDEIPENDYIEYFGPEYKLHFPCTNMENQNSRDFLEEILKKCLHNLKSIDCSGVHITNHKEKTDKKIDADEMFKAKNDQIEDELIDDHITDTTKNII
mmetsp:Transcript_4378/g.3637  ORF Transcript_4378/g.3637 Transcript_4378/m.3637 type:complete len:127 (-) Transcript_4378:28-408(-)